MPCQLHLYLKADLRISPAERQSLMVRARRAVTQAQRNVVEACEEKEKTKRADQV